ncbi:MAG: NUDIX domain-containing protein [Clostridia bacterium]|nr:NUDIX domain-containing protein [Clostridia bacterium]
MKERYKSPIAVYIILRDYNKRILLMRRKNTGFHDGLWSLPSGHVEKNESIQTAIIREAKEEINIRIIKKNLKLKYIIHRKSTIDTYIDCFFECNIWKNNVKNNELQKCSDIMWAKIEELPINIVPYVKNAILSQNKEIIFSTIGLK